MNIDEKPSAWPIVLPDEIGVPDYECDLAYMGFNLRLKICNNSPYLVHRAELRVDGRGPGSWKVVTSREVRVGPLFPGVRTVEEVGIGAQGGITGLGFSCLAAEAVRLTPPDQMVPAAEYPELAAKILDVTADREATAIRIRVRNAGPAVVERVRLKISYFETARGEAKGGEAGPRPIPVAEWILDMPRREWDPYDLPDSPEAACDPADPLPPGQTYEFTLRHCGGVPCDWAGVREATAIEVTELKLLS
ncbi:MAG: hypothetical protein A2Y69_09425 [Candidatus Aminicenantes bacterium RBG_13_59_9]|nr:MAG: hypothetical protein A2Y69_09425 [Candidatus Aminicenantes bacterium RBG_13_59_9]